MGDPVAGNAAWPAGRKRRGLPQHLRRSLMMQDHRWAQRTPDTWSIGIIMGACIQEYIATTKRPAPSPSPKPNEKMQNTPTPQPTHQPPLPPHPNSPLNMNTHPQKRQGRRGGQVPLALPHSATRHITDLLPPTGLPPQQGNQMLAKGHNKGEESKKVNISPTPSAMLFSFPAVQYPFLLACPPQQPPLPHHGLTSPSEPNSTHTAQG